jgi:GT2 family glycosyltransferase
LSIRRPAFIGTPVHASASGGNGRQATALRSLELVQAVSEARRGTPVPARSDSGTARATSVSVIVPATDAPETLLHCCDALLASESPPDEIVIIDNPVTANAATARNLGAERSTGDILLFIDADVQVRADTVGRIRAAFDADPSLAALFGSYDDAPAAPGIASRFRNLLHHQVHQSAPGPASTFWTGLGAVRREAFAAVGGFDENVEFMEDVEFGMRMSAAGQSIVLDPGIQGTHLKHWTVWGMLRTDIFGRGVPWIRLMLRHGRATNTLNLGWRQRLSVLASLSVVLALALLQPLAALAALASVVVLNWRFYALLLRRRGPVEAAAGVLLHVLHYLACAVSIPIGVALHLRDTRRMRRSREADEELPGAEEPVVSPV